MLRVFAPQLPLYGVGIVLTGVLQAHRRFAWPVIAPLLSSLTVVVVYLVFAGVAGTGASVAQAGRGGELVLSVGTTLGVVVLSLSLLVPLRRLRLTLRPGYALPPDARARVRGLAVAGVVTVTAQQVALAVILYRLSSGRTEAFLSATLRGVLLCSFLGAAALVGAAGPIGRFFPLDSDATAAAIAGYAPGLLGYGLFAVLSRALYARGATRAATVTITAGWLAVPLVLLPLSALLPVADRVLAVRWPTRRECCCSARCCWSRSPGRRGAAERRGRPPARWTALMQGMLSGVLVAVVFLAVVWLVDRQDLRPLLTGLGRRLRRARPADRKEEASR